MKHHKLAKCKDRAKKMLGQMPSGYDMKAIRRVRTPEGVRRYKVPINTPIVNGVPVIPKPVQRVHLNSRSNANPRIANSDVIPFAPKTKTDMLKWINALHNHVTDRHNMNLNDPNLNDLEKQKSSDAFKKVMTNLQKARIQNSLGNPTKTTKEIDNVEKVLESHNDLYKPNDSIGDLIHSDIGGTRKLKYHLERNDNKEYTIGDKKFSREQMLKEHGVNYTDTELRNLVEKLTANISEFKESDWSDVLDETASSDATLVKFKGKPQSPSAWWKEEDALALNLEKDENMTTSDAQSVAMANMRKKYGVSYEDLFTLKRKSLNIEDGSDKKIMELAEYKSLQEDLSSLRVAIE